MRYWIIHFHKEREQRQEESFSCIYRSLRYSFRTFSSHFPCIIFYAHCSRSLIYCGNCGTYLVFAIIAYNMLVVWPIMLHFSSNVSLRHSLSTLRRIIALVIQNFSPHFNTGDWWITLLCLFFWPFFYTLSSPVHVSWTFYLNPVDLKPKSAHLFIPHFRCFCLFFFSILFRFLCPFCLFVFLLETMYNIILYIQS